MAQDKTGCYMDHWNPTIDGEFPAGWYLGDHIHNVTKGDAVYKGKVEINVRQPDSSQIKYNLNSGDILYMPPNVIHDSGVLEHTIFYDSYKN